jgi:hypothetical protein
MGRSCRNHLEASGVISNSLDRSRPSLTSEPGSHKGAVEHEQRTRVPVTMNHAFSSPGL